MEELDPERPPSTANLAMMRVILDAVLSPGQWGRTG